MTYRKGEKSAAAFERELPHHVLVTLPSDAEAIGYELARLCEYLGGRRGRAQRHGIGDSSLYCFPLPEVAVEFARRVSDASLTVQIQQQNRKPK